jgi:hypothetical protein
LVTLALLIPKERIRDDKDACAIGRKKEERKGRRKQDTKRKKVRARKQGKRKIRQKRKSGIE